MKKIIFILVLVSQIFAQNLPKGTSIHLLDNGLQVLLIENPLLPMTGINVVVKTGSAYETFATSGMSHMLEHLLFNGTSTRTQEQLYEEVDLIGGYNNANTSFFYTNYMMVTPAEHIKKGMEIQADMLFRSVLPDDKFEKEKGIVLEEIAKSLNSGNSQIERNNHSVLFQNHAYSLPTLGTYATIHSMQRDEVYAFYKNSYVPNNMLMSIIGNFHTDSLLTWIKKYYGSIPPANVSRSIYAHWKTGLENVKDVQSGIYHRSYNGTEQILDIFNRIPLKLNAIHVEILQTQLQNLISQFETSFKQKYPDNVESVKLTVLSSPIKDYLHVSMRLKEDFITPSLIRDVSNYLREISLLPNPQAIKTLAVQAKTDFFKNIEKPHMFGIYNAELFAVYGIEAVLNSYKTHLYQNAATELAAVRPDTHAVVIVHHPQAGRVDVATASVEQAQRYVDTESGLTVITRQNPASDLLAIHYLFKHKASFESEFGADAAWILHECIDQRLKKPEVQKQGSRFGFTFTLNDNPYIPMDNIYLHPDFSYIRAEGLASEIEQGIQFLNNLLIQFSPSIEEFENAQAKRRRIKGMTMPGDKTRQEFESTFQSVVYKPNPFANMEKELTFESLQAFSSIFLLPENTIISVVSPAESALIRDLMVKTYATETQIKTPPPQVFDQELQIPEQAVNKNIGGQGEQAFIFWGFCKEVDPEDRPALKALSLLLDDKITFEIREKQGRAYRMDAGIEQRQNTALFYLRLGTRPENIDPIQKQAPSFFTPGYLNDVTPTQLTKSINMYLGRMMFRRLSSINQAFYLAHSEYFHNDIHFDMHLLEKLQGMQLAEVQAVAERYLKDITPISVISN